MTIGTPASMAALKGASSQSRSSSSVFSLTMAPSWLSPITPPMPGKCLALQSTPASTKPSTCADTMLPTIAGSVPNERSAMTSVEGSPQTSESGAKSKLKPRSLR